MTHRVYRAMVVQQLLQRGWRPPPLTVASDRVLGSLEECESTTMGLTDRECEVLSLVAHGLTSVEAGERLGRSAETVKTLTQDARRKLDARNTTNAVAIAVDEGLISSDTGWEAA